MPFFVCVVPVCPVRAEASHRSEQVTQLLFGEKCEQLETEGDFVRTRLLFDNYTGWCQRSQLEVVEQREEPFENVDLAANWVNRISYDDQPMFLPFASVIPRNRMIGKHRIIFDGPVMDTSSNNMSAGLLKTLAFTLINTPYLWGGRSVFGIDCSGFTQLIFKCMNISILRDASQQVTQGDEVGFLQEGRLGDLAFFNNPARKITHVGILLDQETIIHAAGKVRIDIIDTQGIVNRDTGQRTHQLRVIKRIVKMPDEATLF